MGAVLGCVSSWAMQRLPPWKRPNQNVVLVAVPERRPDSAAKSEGPVDVFDLSIPLSQSGLSGIPDSSRVDARRTLHGDASISAVDRNAVPFDDPIPNERISPQSAVTQGEPPPHNEAIVREAKNELRQLPELSDALAANPDPPLTLLKTLDHIYPTEVFRFLELKEIIELRGLSRACKQLVDGFFLNAFLPETYLTFEYETLDDEEEWRMGRRYVKKYRHLLPVIKRVPEGFRVLPHSRIVYEIKPDETPCWSHSGRDRPIKIVLHLPDGRQIPRQLNTPHSRNSRERSMHLIDLTNPTRMEPYYRFDKFNTPVHLFYKEDRDHQDIKLHCISIPLDYVRSALFENRKETQRVFKSPEASPQTWRRW